MRKKYFNYVLKHQNEPNEFLLRNKVQKDTKKNHFLSVTLLLVAIGIPPIPTSQKRSVEVLCEVKVIHCRELKYSKIINTETGVNAVFARTSTSFGQYIKGRTCMATMVELIQENTRVKGKYIAAQKDVRRLEERVESLKNELKVLKGVGSIYDLMAKVESLELENKNLTEEVRRRRKVDGRPQKIQWQERELIQEKRKEGWSIQKLADAFDCSKTTIQKICKGIEVDLRRKS